MQTRLNSKPSGPRRASGKRPLATLALGSLMLISTNAFGQSAKASNVKPVSQAIGALRTPQEGTKPLLAYRAPVPPNASQRFSIPTLPAPPPSGFFDDLVQLAAEAGRHHLYWPLGADTKVSASLTLPIGLGPLQPIPPAFSFSISLHSRF